MNNYITNILHYFNIDSDKNGFMYWIIIAIVALLIFYMCSAFCRHILIPLIKKLTKRTSTKWDDIILNERTLKNACNLIPGVIIIMLLPLAIEKNSTAYIFTIKVCWIYLIIVSVKFICSILSVLYIISNESERTKNHTLQGVFQMMKIVAICIGAIIIISTLINKNPITILAGLGASAAVLMLVFKDSIMGLVAGVQLSANDMLRPGDWIEMPKYGADGTVIEVTLTTVKVQNWDKTITTIPPYALISDSFQNWRGMWNNGGRRIKRSLYIDMNSISVCSNEQLKTFAQKGWIEKSEETNTEIVNLTVFRNHLEDYLRNHKQVNNEMLIMVRQLQPTPQGLPLELYFFYDGINWVPYEHLQAEIFEHVFAMLPQFGLRIFQNPSGNDFKENNTVYKTFKKTNRISHKNKSEKKS